MTRRIQAWNIPTSHLHTIHILKTLCSFKILCSTIVMKDKIIGSLVRKTDKDTGELFFNTFTPDVH